VKIVLRNLHLRNQEKKERDLLRKKKKPQLNKRLKNLFMYKWMVIQMMISV